MDSKDQGQVLLSPRVTTLMTTILPPESCSDESGVTMKRINKAGDAGVPQLRSTIVNGRGIEESEKYDDERDDLAMSAVTPSKRNKRKMTEPKKRRTDFSIRSLCSNSDEDDDDEEAEGAPRSDVEERSGEEQNGNKSGAKRKRDSEARGEPVVPTSRREENFGNNGTGLVTFGSNLSPFLPPPGFSFVPINTGTAAYQASCGVATSAISSLLSPFPFGSTGDTIVATIPPPPPIAVGDHSRSSDGSSTSTADPIRPGIPSPASFRFDGSPPMDFPAAVHARRPRKNYKNMTKQRRVEANARERTRVHTISAAFESLRRAVPSYSYNQRLSKLAILRIACSYILALARLAEFDYSEGQSGMTFGDCVDMCTRTIQAEGKAKRRH